MVKNYHVKMLKKCQGLKGTLFFSGFSADLNIIPDPKRILIL
jgi:hypothetical protein